VVGWFGVDEDSPFEPWSRIAKTVGSQEFEIMKIVPLSRLNSAQWMNGGSNLLILYSNFQ